MKLSTACSTVFLTTCVALFASCSSDSTTEQNNDSAFDTRGSDYMPVQSNQVVTGHIQGSRHTYDANGFLTGLDSVDQDRTSFVIGSASVAGLPAYSIGAHDDYGRIADNGGPSFYIAFSSGTVYVLGNDDNTKHMLLPGELSIGLKWNAIPESDNPIRATLVNHMDMYTNHNGNSYPNVIQVGASFNDSSFVGGHGVHGMEVFHVTASCYFAKDVGLVDVTFHNSEHIIYPINKNDSYSREVYNVVIARNK